MSNLQIDPSDPPFLQQLKRYTQRHPRFLVCLAVSAFLALVYYRQQVLALDVPFPLGGQGTGTAVGGRGRALSIADEIRVNERRYQQTLEDRYAYIERLGGKGRVNSWPGGGAPYTLWDFFLPSFECPHHVDRIGTVGDGGKWMCGMELVERKPKSVIYTFGVSTDSSFEAALLRRAPGSEVWGYDYSVNSFGPEIVHSPELVRRAHFFKYAIGSADAHGPSFDPAFQVYTLETLMKENGHTWIDILKIDVEGAEFAVLRGVCEFYLGKGRPLPFGQLQVEIHAWDRSVAFQEFLEWWELLERAGLRPFRQEPNLVYVNLVGGKPTLSEYSFINIQGTHELVRDM